MKGMMIVAAALALAACTSEASAPPKMVTFACYADGYPTAIIEGVDIAMEARLVGGHMVETWSIEQPPSMNGRTWVHHEARPDEVCGPETPPPPMMD